MSPKALVVVAQYTWDGCPETLINSTQFLAMAWIRRGRGPVLVVNLCPWERLRRWPLSFLRLLPGLRRTSQEGLHLLNRWGPDWRKRSHQGRPLPVAATATAIRHACARLGMRDPLLVVGDPVHARLFGLCGEAARVYFATDDLSAGDAAHAESIRADEDVAVRKADLVLGVSQALHDRDAPRARSAMLLPNGVDAQGLRELAAAPGPVRGWGQIPGPKVVYLGYLNRRVDYPSLIHAVRGRPHVSFILIGPEDRRDPAVAAAIAELRLLPNAWFMGPRNRRDLARIVTGCDVGLIPYRLDPFNVACSPLKVLEYAALGLPVVASPLPGLQAYKTEVRFAQGEALGPTIDEELANGAARRAAMTALADRETWESRVDRVAQGLEALHKRRGIDGPPRLNEPATA